jgi:ribonucleotide reductase beta subunit family protein with ferritin-like domain
MWEMYKQALASFWTVDEVDLGHDARDWARLSPPERSFIKTVLAFFAASDGVVLENLGANFMTGGGGGWRGGWARLVGGWG